MPGRHSGRSVCERKEHVRTRHTVETDDNGKVLPIRATRTARILRIKGWCRQRRGGRRRVAVGMAIYRIRRMSVKFRDVYDGRDAMG